MNVKIKKLSYPDRMSFSFVPPNEQPLLLLTCGIMYEKPIQTPYGKIPHPNDLIKFIRENRENLPFIVQKIAEKNKLDLQVSDVEIPFPLEDIPDDFGDRVSVRILPALTIMKTLRTIFSFSGGRVWGNLFSRRFVYFPEFLIPSKPYVRSYYSSINPDRVRWFYERKSRIKLVKFPLSKTHLNIVSVDYKNNSFVITSFFGRTTQPLKSPFYLEMTLNNSKLNATIIVLDKRTTLSRNSQRIYSFQTPSEEKLINILATTTLLNVLLTLLNPPRKVSLYSNLGRYAFIKTSFKLRELYAKSKRNLQNLIDTLIFLSSLVS